MVQGNVCKQMFLSSPLVYLCGSVANSGSYFASPVVDPCNDGVPGGVPALCGAQAAVIVLVWTFVWAILAAHEKAIVA